MEIKSNLCNNATRKTAKEAKLLALTLAGLNPAMIIRIKAKQVN